MAGFKLIETYLSSESENDDEKIQIDEKMSCETLTSKDNQDCEQNRKQLLPLPSWISKKCHENEKIALIPNENEIDKHEGRIRSFKHERGNWATLVYISYSPSELLMKWMSSIVETLPIKGNLIIDEFHLSLTRTLILKYHWIESFTNSLKKLCRSIDKFTMIMNNVKLYCNEQRTRTFIGIECQSIDQHFIYLIESINKLLADYELPSFYKDASYHISFFWTLGDKESELKPFITLLNDSLHDTLTRDVENNSIHVSTLHSKIGNKIYMFPLR